MRSIPSASARRRRSSNAGFSLVEMLAALVVTVLLVMAALPLVRGMLATSTRGAEVADMVELQVRGIGVLRDDLRHAIVWTGYGPAQRLMSFRGNATSMSFPAVTGFGVGRDGVELISIRIANSADGHAVVRSHSPIVGSTYTAFRDPVIVFSGPYRYVLKYYASDGAERSDWTDPQSTPARIVIEITDRFGRQAIVPIEIPIAASLSTACLLNATLPGCGDVPHPPTDGMLGAIAAMLHK